MVLYIHVEIILFVNTLTGKTVIIDIQDLMVDLKEKVEDLTSNGCYFDGKQLEDTRRVSVYGVEKGDTLHLVLHLCGAGAHTYYIDDSPLYPAFDYLFKTFTRKNNMYSGLETS